MGKTASASRREGKTRGGSGRGSASVFSSFSAAMSSAHPAGSSGREGQGPPGRRSDRHAGSVSARSRKAVKLVEDHLDDPQFSVSYLCESLCMSRSQLYRKFESITGQTPNDFIRSVRLKHAAQLLKTGNSSISEISDRVGFNSIKYFNKYFKEEFGVTPTQYRAGEEKA